MTYQGSKDEAYTLLEMRLQSTVSSQIQLAQNEANKGNADLMEIYGDVARFCLQQLEKVEAIKKADMHEIHFPHIEAIYENQR